MRYSRKISNYLKRITLFAPTHVMSLADPIAISVVISRMDCECSYEKEFTKLICMNPLMVLHLTVNHVDSCHSCVIDPLT